MCLFVGMEDCRILGPSLLYFLLRSPSFYSIFWFRLVLRLATVRFLGAWAYSPAFG